MLDNIVKERWSPFQGHDWSNRVKQNENRWTFINTDKGGDWRTVSKDKDEVGPTIVDKDTEVSTRLL